LRKDHRVTVLVFLFLVGLRLSAQSQTNSSRIAAGQLPSYAPGAAPVWIQGLGDTVIAMPYLQAESVVVAGAQGSVKSFSVRGTPLWNFDVQGGTPYIARSREGTSYVCSKAGIFTAINRVGRELWRVDLGKPLSFPALVGWDGRVFIPAGRELFCRTSAGFPLWRQDLGSPFAIAPVSDHAGGLAAVLENREFLRVNQFGAVERQTLDRIPALIVPLKEGDRHSYIILYPQGEAEKISLDPGAGAGKQLSRSRFPSLPGEPVAAADYGAEAAVTLRDGRVLLLAGSNGQNRWIRDSHEAAGEKGGARLRPTESFMVFDERGIFAVSTRGATAFAADGRRRWIIRFPETTAIPVLSDEGLLYVCGADRRLSTYKVERRARNVPRSIFGPEPEGSYDQGNPPPPQWANSSAVYDEGSLKTMSLQIDEAAQNSRIGEHETEYIATLMFLSGGILSTPGQSRVRAQVQVIQRVECIRLLARIGSRETIPFLVNLFYRDTDPTIKAACCEAIGRIGVDPKGEAFRAYQVLLAPDNATLDPMVLMAATSSIAALCRFSGPPLAGEGIRLLNAFGHMDFPPRVKRQAQAELDALRKEGLDQPITR
jgi:outer membrane protein assembly factor BamB